MSAKNKKPSGRKTIYIIIAIVIALSAVTLFYNQKNTSPQNQYATQDWQIYINNKEGFSFKYPQNASVDAEGVDASSHFVTVKSAGLDVVVSVDSVGYDPGELDADKILSMNVNGVLWKGRYDRPNKCISSCSASTELTAVIDGHSVGYVFRGDMPPDEVLKNYLSTFTFTK